MLSALTQPLLLLLPLLLLPQLPLLLLLLLLLLHRYCPSIEDKIVRFADKASHQIFLEPEGRSTPELYVQVSSGAAWVQRGSWGWGEGSVCVWGGCVCQHGIP